MKFDRHFVDYEPVTHSRRARSWEDEGDTALAVAWPQAPGVGESVSLDGMHAAAEGPATRVAGAVPPKQSASPGAKKKKGETWVAKRGHAFSYFGLFIFTAILYFRPYELIPALEGHTWMAYVSALVTLIIFFPSQLALEGNLTSRPREVNLVLLFCVCALLSIPLAISPSEAWVTFNDVLIKAVLMFIVMINAVRTERRLKGMFFLAIAVSCWLSVGALADYAAGNVSIEGYRVAGRIHGMFENPNDLALQLVTILPIAIAFFFTSRGPMKLLYLVCAGLMVAATTVTFSRTGFLGLVGVVAVLGWKIGRKHRLAVFLSLFIFVSGFFALAPGGYSDRLGSILDHSLDLVGSAGQRQELLIRSIIVSAKHPLLGIGMGNFHIVSIRESVSHNAYTQVSAELGLTALIIYVMFIVTPLKRLKQMERETLDDHKRRRFYYLSVCLQASLVGYMIVSFFASVAYHWYVYYLVGYVVCLRRLYSISGNPERTADSEGEVPKERSGNDWAAGISPQELQAVGR